MKKNTSRSRNQSRGLFLLAAAAQWAIRQHMPEVQTIITAGTANFRFRTEENDDGISATHFSYEFETMAAIARAANGDLPEMHAWVVVHPETRDITKMELVDLSTGDQLDQMKRIVGLEWDKELLPPDYLWCRADHIPDGILYRSHPAARQIAMHFLERRSTWNTDWRNHAFLRTRNNRYPMGGVLRRDGAV